MHRPVCYPLKQKTFSVVFSDIFEALSATKAMSLCHTLPQLSKGTYIVVKWQNPCDTAVLHFTGGYQQTHQHCTSEERSHKILNKNKHMVTPWEVKQEALKESTNHSNINSWLPLDSQDFLGQGSQRVCDLAALSWPDSCFGSPSKKTDGNRAVAVQELYTEHSVLRRNTATGPKESSCWHTT